MRICDDQIFCQSNTNVSFSTLCPLQVYMIKKAFKEKFRGVIWCKGTIKTDHNTIKTDHKYSNIVNTFPLVNNFQAAILNNIWLHQF